MNKALYLIITFVLLGCSATTLDKSVKEELEIGEIAPDKRTAMTKQNLRHLAKVYHLRPLLFTRKINIRSGKEPQSHPVLTLNTKYADVPNKLLAQWLHEEFHWWAMMNPQKMKGAIKDLRKIYPRIPKESHAKDVLASYSHLIICYLEYEALTYYLGNKQARSILQDFIKREKLFPWTYYQILHKNFPIKQVVEKHDLLPPPLS